MINVSKNYINQIKKVPFRNRSFVDVIVGVINKQAQNGVKFADGQQYLEYSNKETPFGKEKVSKRYATYEPNYMIPDKMYFVGKPYTNQGAVIKNRGVVARIHMNDTYDLSGLTINFGTKYPTLFRLILDDETRVIANHKQEWVYTEPITTQDIVIEPIDFVAGGVARLRIESFKCGYYKTFDNDSIVSLTYEESISPVSAELSQNSVTLKAENFGRKYDVEKEDDISRFFILGQDVNVNFGYQLNDGSVEYVDMGNLSLESWEADSKNLTLKGSSYINTLDEICLIGEYSESGKTLYQLAVEVFNDLGINARDYSIDNRLSQFITHNPLPQLSHAQLLQIIANAGQCTLLRDRNNMYKIIPTCFVNDDDIVFTITDNGHTEKSNPSKLIDLIDGKRTDYIADYSHNYIRVDNQMYFTGNDNQGYISSMLADASGNFTTNPRIKIEMNKPMQLTGWTFDFVGAIPEKAKIYTYYNGNLTGETEYDINQKDMKFAGNFGLVDRVDIEITKGSPNARVHIAYITTPPIVFTFTTDRDVIGSTVAKMEDKCKMVELEGSKYEVQEETDSAYSEDIEIEEGLDYSNWDIVFNNCIIPNKVYVDDIETTPKKISGQHVILDLSSKSVGSIVQVRVSGNSLTTKVKIYRNQVDEKGATEKYQNPLIDNDILGHANVEWLGIYESFIKSYTIENRGYPELEVNDLVGLEIPQLNKIANLRLISHQITFTGGGLKGKDVALREI